MDSVSDYSKIVGIMGCEKCWPKLCRCSCPHGIGMNHECANCGRKHEDGESADCIRPRECDCCLSEPEQIPVSIRDGKDVCLICLHEPDKHACCNPHAP